MIEKDGDEGGCSIVQELHVYWTAVPVHGRDPTKFQYQVGLALSLPVDFFSNLGSYLGIRDLADERGGTNRQRRTR